MCRAITSRCSRTYPFCLAIVANSGGHRTIRYPFPGSIYVPPLQHGFFGPVCALRFAILSGVIFTRRGKARLLHLLEQQGGFFIRATCESLR